MSKWVPIAPYRLGKCQTVTIGAAHTESTAQAVGFDAVLLRATSDCHIQIGGSVAATTTDTLILAADPPLVFMCHPGEVVSVIEASAAGTLYVTPLSH